MFSNRDRSIDDSRKKRVICIDIGGLAIMFADIRALDISLEKAAREIERELVPALNPLFDIPRVITISDITPVLTRKCYARNASLSLSLSLSNKETGRSLMLLASLP